ncbi:MAG: Tripartite tricarboxylate transporter TctB family [Candidatus Atribacteria bacterium]|nr:Tripartite tricarboxylate transporter TctB family [Candidatus Atribacteria bacterium]
MSNKKSDCLLNIGVGLLLFIGSLFVFLRTLELPPSPYEPLGPAFLPKTLSTLIGLLSLGIIVQYSLKLRAITNENGTERKKGLSYKLHPLLAVVGLIITAIYIAVMSFGLIGFRPATFMFVLLLGNIIFHYERKLNKVYHHFMLIAISLILSFGLFYVFTNLIHTNLP